MEQNPHLAHVVALATGLQGSGLRRPATLKATIKRQLVAQGWYVRSRFLVASRGTNDHYRGALDLVCWPPPAIPGDPNPHISHRPPPVLLDIDKTAVLAKTRAKMAAFNYPRSGSVVILAKADNAQGVEGIDTIVCLGA